jgi:hypothetical protein
MITRWFMLSFSESRNLRNASIASGSRPVKWASETKIQSFSVSVNPSTLLPEGWDWLRVDPEQLLLSRSEGRGSSAVERVNMNPLPSYAAVVKT